MCMMVTTIDIIVDTIIGIIIGDIMGEDTSSSSQQIGEVTWQTSS